MKKLSEKRSAFMLSLITIAVPVALQNLLSSSVNLLDNLMIGQLGDSAIAGLGIANQVFFLMLFIIFGINNGGAILVSQFWGKKDIPNIRRVLGICLSLGFASASIFTAVSIFSPAFVIRLFSADEQVIASGSAYLGIVGFSYIATAVSFSFAILLRSVEKAFAPMIISFIAVALNCAGNYVLIFGLYGFPRMGVAGAALATCIARYAECALLLILVYAKKYPLAGKIREFFGFSRELLARYAQRAVPVIFQEFSWALGITLYQVIYARIGTAALAAVNIVSTFERFLFVVFVGIGSAAGVMVGKSIGEDKNDQAHWLGKNYCRLGVAAAFVLGGVILVFRNRVLQYYQISPEVILLASGMFTVLAFLLWMKAGNMLLISGVFRSGGDTRFAFILDTAGVWAVGLPLGLLVAFAFHANPVWVYLLIGTEELIKLAFAAHRFNSRKWINNLVKNIA
jgi:putative MATE family efflux protein